VAKTISNVKICVTSANTELDIDQLLVEYRASEGDLSKLASMTISGVSPTDTVTGMWTTVISEINTAEGI